MKQLLFAMSVVMLAVLSIAASARQAPDDERRAAIRVLRAINTAENAAKQKSGKYLAISELLEHPGMGGVRPDFTVNGNAITYRDAQVRLALSADATQYIVTVVGRAPSYTAAFSDEQGVIYTGKALE
jgi:hypothetical protein